MKTIFEHVDFVHEGKKPYGYWYTWLQIYLINFQTHSFFWTSGQSFNVGDLYSNSNHVSVHIWLDMCEMFMREKSELSIFLTLYTQRLKETFQNGSLKHWSIKVISKRIIRRKYCELTMIWVCKRLRHIL